MRHMKKTSLLMGACLMLASAQAGAHFIDQPVKWSQVPWDPYGNGYGSDCVGNPDIGHPPQVYVDDFACKKPAGITAVRWWGAYPEPYPIHNHGGAAVGPFHITFHHSTGSHPQSIPADLIQMYTVQAQEVYVAHDASNQYAVYRYDAYLPDTFDQYRYSQQPGPDGNYNIGELFLGICKPTSEFWSWWEVSGEHPVLDYAKWAQSHTGPWSANQTNSTDLAFELMIPEPATMTLLALGGLGVLIRRRRT